MVFCPHFSRFDTLPPEGKHAKPHSAEKLLREGVDYSQSHSLLTYHGSNMYCAMSNNIYGCLLSILWLRAQWLLLNKR